MTTDIQQLGTILCVFAHPDDETFTMGGIIAAARKNGQRVICITATHGELGVQDEQRWPLEHLGDIRTKELAEALKILGVEHHFYLDIYDGSCAEAPEGEMVDRIARLIDTYQPDSIMTFGPDGLTGHPDHCAVSAWARHAKERAGSEARIYHAVLTNDQYARSQAFDTALNFFYNTPKPPTVNDQDAAICLMLNDELFQIKMQALRAMPSQYQIMFEKFDEPALRGCFDVEAFVAA